ncbi:MAG: hypothetical protein HYX67_15540 [Candidatus Melainabacteria bacterium]|nr:hypothetical protein [Candidatus Melainabacteria bacterium]
MNVQFAGTLQYQLQLSEVLRRVMEGQPESLSALLLTDEHNGRHGTICIAQSRYISGAELKDGEYQRIATGYEALKIIAGLVSANFKYITAPPEFFENTELTLNIEIEKLLLCLPELPQDVSELQDSDSLLDRVFSQDEVTAATPVKVLAPSEPRKKKATWHSVPVSRAAEVFVAEEPEEEPPKKYTTMEQRALAELGPPGVQKMKKKKSWIFRLFKRIGYFFYSLYTAPVHVIKKLAKPIALLVAVVVVYQAWIFLEPMIRGMKLTLLPAPKHQTTAPEHVVRSAPTYHAPAVHRSNSSSTPHPYNPTSNTITITQPVVENKPIVPYTTPEVLPVYPHRRAYQVVPQAHPSNNTIAPPSSNAAASAPSEPPHSVPSTNSAEQ